MHLFKFPFTNTKIIIQYRLTYTFVVIWIAYRVYEKNEIIEQRIQNHWNFAVVLNGRWFASFPCETRFAQTSHQASCEPFKTAAKFQWFWILSIIISFFSYTRTAIQITTGVYVIRYGLIIFVFVDRRLCELVSLPNFSLLECLPLFNLLFAKDLLVI